MSGPIIRKYGFPNFEKIFGERELKHGADAQSSTPAPALPPEDSPKSTQTTEPAKSDQTQPKP